MLKVLLKLKAGWWKQPFRPSYDHISVENCKDTTDINQNSQII